ncbi:MAG: TonB-dependent receptor [Flavobacteriales bacterium]|nr:TonB-dependent receptor [Flavobacteriales bacterium]
MLFTGQVVDAQSDEPLPYVTVAVIEVAQGQMLTGTTTDIEGKFSIQVRGADIRLEISFIGYEKMSVTDWERVGGLVDLGILRLERSTTNLDEAEVTAERSTVEFKLDKRVFNVGKDISSTGMGALEVLNNVPSVNVDIEGNVKLRGNSGVQILINGKPSVLSDDPGKALGTITADMIESVEVITNPSAKYEAGGTSGIINIVLKKDEKKGFNGSISVNAGYPHNHSIGVSLNRRTEKFNLFTQIGGGYRSMPFYSRSENLNLLTDSLIRSEGVSYRDEKFANITLGADYYINKLNTITLSGNFAYEWESQPSETEFFFYHPDGELATQYTRVEETGALNPKYQYDLQYKKQFTSHKDHVLLFSATGRFFGKDQSSEFRNESASEDLFVNLQKTQTTFHEGDHTFKLDYTNPLTKAVTIELGSMYDIQDVGNDYAVFDDVNGVWVADSGLTNNFAYNQKVLGVYGTGAYEGKKWGVKLGVRVENTDLRTTLINTNEANNQLYTNFFPSAHLSYKFNEMFSMQTGYSRRIFRPRLWDLNPFFNIRNTYSIRTGNPKLGPEFGDSYELTAIFIFQKASINTSIYHLYTTDVIENIATFEDNVTINRPENVGSRRKTGFELNGKYQPLKWLTFNGDFNYGRFDRKGQYGSQDFSFSNDQWSSRLTAKIKLKYQFDVELTGSYQSREQTVQGYSSGFASGDFGLRKKIKDGRVVVNFAVRDIFASRKRESFVDQPNYYLYNYNRRGRFITLGVSVSFGKGEAMTYSGGGRRH